MGGFGDLQGAASDLLGMGALSYEEYSKGYKGIVKLTKSGERSSGEAFFVHDVLQWGVREGPQPVSLSNHHAPMRRSSRCVADLARRLVG